MFKNLIVLTRDRENVFKMPKKFLQEQNKKQFEL